jgi:hypothetical protein
MHGRCLTLHGGRHACDYACVHATTALLVLHACMSYLYVCMCRCTVDTCLLVLSMLVVYACCLCASLVCVVNGKSRCCLGGCFVLLYLLRIYECAVAMHGEERGRERWEVGPAVVAACELLQSTRGSERGCAAAAMVAGSVHAPLSGIGRSEREGERGEERAGDADATEQNIN